MIILCFALWGQIGDSAQIGGLVGNNCPRVLVLSWSSLKFLHFKAPVSKATLT